MKYYVTIGSSTREVVLDESAGDLRVSVDGKELDVSCFEVDRLGQMALTVDGRSYAVSIEGGLEECAVTVAGRVFPVAIEDERERAAHAAEKARNKGGGELKSVMPGVVVEILVEIGQAVEEGQPLVILEAMKMQNEIGAPATGVVKRIWVEEGAAVAGGAKLITLEAPQEAE